MALPNDFLARAAGVGFSAGGESESSVLWDISQMQWWMDALGSTY